ncbi:hypothetical protein P9112_007381 [Eukaryota sp. TZLM1-RC]
MPDVPPDVLKRRKLHAFRKHYTTLKHEVRLRQSQCKPALFSKYKIPVEEPSFNERTSIPHLSQVCSKLQRFKSLVSELEQTPNISDSVRESYLQKLQSLMEVIEADIVTARADITSESAFLDGQEDHLSCAVNSIFEKALSWPNESIVRKTPPISRINPNSRLLQARPNSNDFKPNASLIIKQEVSENKKIKNKNKLNSTADTKEKVLMWKLAKEEQRLMEHHDNQRRMVERKEKEAIRLRMRRSELRRKLKEKQTRKYDVESVVSCAEHKVKKSVNIELLNLKRQEEIENAKQRALLRSQRRASSTPRWTQLPAHHVPVDRDPSRLMRETQSARSKKEGVNERSNRDSGFILHSARKIVPSWRRGL